MKTRRTHLLIGVSPALRGMSVLADTLDATPFLPDRRTLREFLARARTDSEQVGVLLPSTQPELVLLAGLLDFDRLAVFHGPGPGARRLSPTLLRAAFAGVDLTVTPDEASAKEVIALGADPDRLADHTGDVRIRLFSEPRRRPGAAFFKEAAASLGLDLLASTGALGLLERLGPRGVNVVNYHRVLPLPELRSYCRPQMAIGAPLFEAQLETIAEARGFVPLGRMKEQEASDRVSITFDDGYEDNFRVALPILARFSAPACIFLVTSLIGQPDALWWDRVGLSLFAWWRSGAEPPVPEALPARARQLLQTQSYLEARELISLVLSDLNHASNEAREAAVAAAESLLPRKIAKRTMLSWQEVEALNRAGVYFGSHTRSHVPLDELPPNEAEAELSGGQADLESHQLRRAVRVTALPRGRLGPLTEAELARRFDAVMTTEPGLNPPGERALFVKRRDGRMLTLAGRHHPAKLRLELTGLIDPLRQLLHTGGVDY